MKVRCRLIATVFLACFPFLSGHRLSFSTEYRGRKAVRVMFYNVENLFHPGSDSLNPDREFTPSGSRAWTWEKYRAKVNRVARVILACGGWEPPAILGLCEVEGRNVLFDLVKRSPLEKYGYRFVHYESPDPRGIDVALLYRPEKVEVLSQARIGVSIPMGDASYASRDLLHVMLRLLGEDTLHVIVNHWPSRRSGASRSRWKRIRAASALCEYASVNIPPTSQVLLMGDFNDESADSSMAFLRHCFRPELCSLPLPLPSHEDVGGTLVFDPGTGTQWYCFDHILVSRDLLDSTAPLFTDSLYHVFSAPWILEEGDVRGGNIPYRTYRGYKYREGFSDHLPVLIDLFRRD